MRIDTGALNIFDWCQEPMVHLLGKYLAVVYKYRLNLALKSGVKGFKKCEQTYIYIYIYV